MRKELPLLLVMMKMKKSLLTSTVDRIESRASLPSSSLVSSCRASSSLLNFKICFVCFLYLYLLPSVVF